MDAMVEHCYTSHLDFGDLIGAPERHVPSWISSDMISAYAPKPVRR
jgi:hypothetical protein